MDKPPPPSAAIAPTPIKIDVQFINFSKYGNVKSDGKEIALTQVDKWFKQAEVFNKQLTMTDTGISFNKFKSKSINFNNFMIFLDELAQSKGVPLDEIKDKLMTCGPPGVTKTVAPKGSATEGAK